ncbi:L-threonylcarbamoyladenylate synthase [Robiginitalea sp. M366]|uniref:L-threonylcarbamoyladenylate synthase n=1 Tax=Robiginitalea aestuariiviva TaxID=3036903 RepID=UPI00240E94C4|nr:L-threonylcarbamoyladenylate synthase [Robiginitalea aestuariiviva]MDG1571079.1 L-threonylcarbamoyladenylate synthase [Robiginitalea aestuariiviva]
MDPLDQAAACIREGKVVAFPTETVYGLGANALDPMAAARIFELKERPAFDPLIVHIADLSQLQLLTPSKDPRLTRLAEAFWPGPLTVVVPKTERVPDLVTSGLPTVGVRMPDHPMAQELIRRSGCPIAAPSANKFGRISPTAAQHVTRHMPEVDFVLDGGETRVGIESTIIALRPDGYVILRPGAITREDLNRILPESASPVAAGSPEAPGMLASHYSPAKPFHLFTPTLLQRLDPSKCGFISYRGNAPQGFARVLTLAPDGDLKAYAAGIFGAMHQLEASGVECLVAEPVPEQGIGIAIMDRLRKAAHEHGLPG